MAKRFIDTAVFRKPSIRAMKAPYKALFIYLLCECDHAGVWDAEIDIAALRLGMELDAQTAIAELGSAVLVIDGGKKWFLTDFVDYQYGELNPANRVHASVISRLQSLGIWDEKKGLVSPLQGAKDKEKDKDTELEVKEHASAKTLFAKCRLTDLEAVKSALPELASEGVNLEHYRDAIRNWSDTKDEKRSERGWLATFRQWTKTDRDKGELKMVAGVVKHKSTGWLRPQRA